MHGSLEVKTGVIKIGLFSWSVWQLGYDFDMYFDPKLIPPSSCAGLKNTWKRRENVSFNLTQSKTVRGLQAHGLLNTVWPVTVAVSLAVTSGFQNIIDCIITYWTTMPYNNTPEHVLFWMRVYQFWCLWVKLFTRKYLIFQLCGIWMDKRVSFKTCWTKTIS